MKKYQMDVEEHFVDIYTESIDKSYYILTGIK